MDKYERGEIVYYWKNPGTTDWIWVGICTTDTDVDGRTQVWWVRDDQHKMSASEALEKIKIDRIGKVLNMNGKNTKLIMWNGFGYA